MLSVTSQKMCLKNKSKETNLENERRSTEYIEASRGRIWIKLNAKLKTPLTSVLIWQ